MPGKDDLAAVSVRVTLDITRSGLVCRASEDEIVAILLTTLVGHVRQRPQFYCIR